MRPLAIDLFVGIGGWTAGLIDAGFRVVGYDIEDMFEVLGEPKPEHFELVIRDVRTIHGSEFKDADLIVSSSPCQKYSYMAMPWSLAKARAAEIRADETGELLRELNELFEAQFRIQRQANEARAAMGLPPIPMVVENVKGAQPWVGRAKWSFGSYFLWGDIPALMPIQKYHQRLKVKEGEQWNVNRKNFTGTRGWDEGLKNPGFRFDGSGKSFQTESVERHVAEGVKNNGGSWFNIGSPGQKETGRNPVHELAAEGVKNPGRSLDRGSAKFNDRKANFSSEVAEGRKGAGAGAEWFDQNLCKLSSKSSARKAASAKIAKIPFALSSWIGKTYLP